MDLRFYNTLTRQIEPFTPLIQGKVSMYHCGPTVYDYTHIGNLRSFLLSDLLRRACELSGLEVKQVMNITDVDDKTIRRSREEGVTLQELTERYLNAFISDIGSMNIQSAKQMPRATDNVNLMISLIEKLLEKGFAYQGEDGIYFSIEKDQHYGVLAGLTLDREMRERIKNDEYDKDNPQDFALWKFYSEEDGTVVWDAPFGRGRPGWHIECSAMSMDALGETFDIHTGGVDLIFPHHTNEIAQSESATGVPFVKTWLHNNFILVDGKKMSKSLGNILTLRELGEKGFSPLSYRYLLLTAHYRTLLNFTWESLEAANNALSKLTATSAQLPDEGAVDLTYKTNFEHFMGNDLDTPRAIALMWDMLKDENISLPDKKATLLYFDKIFGLSLHSARKPEIPEEILELAQKREHARKSKDWALSDELREKIESAGYSVRDTDNGPKVDKR